MPEKIKATGAKEDKPKNIVKTWVVLASVVSALFAAIGFVMIFIDPEPRYLNGSMYLVSAAAFCAAICVLSKNSAAKEGDVRLNAIFMPGFVLQILGVGPLFSGEWLVARVAGVAAWAAGLAVFILWFVKVLAKKN